MVSYIRKIERLSKLFGSKKMAEFLHISPQKLIHYRSGYHEPDKLQKRDLTRRYNITFNRDSPDFERIQLQYGSIIYKEYEFTNPNPEYDNGFGYVEDAGNIRRTLPGTFNFIRFSYKINFVSFAGETSEVELQYFVKQIYLYDEDSKDALGIAIEFSRAKITDMLRYDFGLDSDDMILWFSTELKIYVYW